MRYARIKNNIVVELFNEKPDFHPDFVAQLIEVDDTVEAGMIKTETGFIHPVSTEKTIDELRAEMKISAANARLNLVKAGIFNAINQQINAMPDDAEIKILWEYETVYERLNPVLVEFCHGIGLTDDKIDELFL